jgi:hypothetical protein
MIFRKKIISFSLYGTKPFYCYGAIRNASLIRHVYPGWIARFYCGGDVPHHVLNRLDDLGCEVVARQERHGHNGMFWRFYPIQDPEVDIWLSRDSDSRLGLRERCVVDEWLKSDKTCHIIRDHPQHTACIMGGMFGINNVRFRERYGQISIPTGGPRYQADQKFLQNKLWPLIANDCVIHDSRKGKIFPCKGNGFIGQRIPITSDWLFL